MITLSQLRVDQLLEAATRTTGENGTGVDLQGSIYPGGRQMKAFLDVGTVGGTGIPTLDVKIQESDALATDYSDITGAAFPQVTESGEHEIHFQTKKRYVRAVTVIADTSPTFDCYCGLLHGMRVVG